MLKNQSITAAKAGRLRNFELMLNNIKSEYEITI